jgi:hypothetical protein
VEGTPQGAAISPLLGNIFLHYALDLWVGQWTRRAATGQMRLVRCRRLPADLRAARGCGQDADGSGGTVSQVRASPARRQNATDRIRTVRCDEPSATDDGRSETFDFLGFTHFCGKTLDGRFMVHRKTQRKAATVGPSGVRHLLCYWVTPCRPRGSDA